MIQQILARCVKKFERDKDNVTYYKAVRQTFDQHPRNVDKTDVLVKFAVLNNLYNTNILAADKMVSHIHKLATREHLDDLLKSGDPYAVERIRKGHRIHREGKRTDLDLYSFATKYCHFSNPKCYPIYDQNVDRAIMKLWKSKKVQLDKQDDLREPQKFRDIIDQIKQLSGLPDYQQVDRALWVYGKKRLK